MSETQLKQALADQQVRETATSEAKQQLPTPGKNKDLAKDITAMTPDGGVLLYGVGGADPTRPDTLTPIAPAGAAERIDHVARSGIAEPPTISIEDFPASSGEGLGYLVVVVPPSPRAPHKLILDGDNRYWGRGPTGNRILGARARCRCCFSRVDTVLTRLQPLRGMKQVAKAGIQDFATNWLPTRGSDARVKTGDYDGFPRRRIVSSPNTTWAAAHCWLYRSHPTTGRVGGLLLCSGEGGSTGTDIPIGGSGSSARNCLRVRWWALIASAALILLMTIAAAPAQAGGLDQSFGTEGKVVLDADGRWLSDLGVDRAGRTLALLTSEPAIVRFLPDGSLDPDFGEGGIHELPRETPFEFGYPVAGELALDSRGRIVVQLVAAVDEGCSGPDYLIRLHANGEPDRGFGVDGVLALEGVDSSFVPSAGMELDGRDRIYLGGSDRNCSSNDPAVLRLKPDGQLDNSYGEGGVFALRGHRFHTYTSFVSDIDVDRRGRAALAARGYKKVGTDPDGSCDCVRGSVAIRLKRDGKCSAPSVSRACSAPSVSRAW